MARDSRESIVDAWHVIRHGWKGAVALAAIASSGYGWFEHELGARDAKITALEQRLEHREKQLTTLGARVKFDEDQLKSEFGSRVRFQAAAAEPDTARRADSGQYALRDFAALVTEWPCAAEINDCTALDESTRWPCKVADNARCTKPDEAARMALETRPPR